MKNLTEGKEFIVKIQERSFKVWETINGQQRIDDITQIVKHLPKSGVIFQAEKKPFDIEDHRDIFVQ